jgi:hypothetical protein
MGRDGAACDNAAMESFSSPLQKNVPDTRRRETREELDPGLAGCTSGCPLPGPFTVTGYQAATSRRSLAQAEQLAAQ